VYKVRYIVAAVSLVVALAVFWFNVDADDAVKENKKVRARLPSLSLSLCSALLRALSADAFVAAFCGLFHREVRPQNIVQAKKSSRALSAQIFAGPVEKSARRHCGSQRRHRRACKAASRLAAIRAFVCIKLVCVVVSLHITSRFL